MRFSLRRKEGIKKKEGKKEGVKEKKKEERKKRTKQRKDERNLFDVLDKVLVLR